MQDSQLKPHALTGRPVISATGLFTPPESITNAELVASFNAFVDRHNAAHAAAIAAGEVEALAYSSVEFIEKASGIKARHVMAKAPVLDPEIMAPRWPERGNDELSIMAEIGVAAAREAMARARREASDVDAVLCAASNMQRAYPAMAIEIQQALGIVGFGFDMNVACSSATFGIQTAADYVRAGHAKSVLVVSPEITSGHLNWRDRDSHFIFGDVATASVLELEDTATSEHQFRIMAEQPITKFSNNIRSNFGYQNVCDLDNRDNTDKYFVQQGRKVFKEVLPMVSQLIAEQMACLNLGASDIKRLFLHQANINMNGFIAKKVLEREPLPEEAPIILDEFANTSSAGCIIALHKHHRDLKSGDKAVLCSFGAGYSAGCLILEHV